MSNTQKTGRVYKLYFRDQPDDLYIGSTMQSLAIRMQNHKHFARNRPNEKSKWYAHMRNQDLNLLRIELLEEVKINNKQELLLVEDRYIRQLNPKFNMRKAHLSDEEKKDYFKLQKQTPQYKAYIKEYNARPETKANMKAYGKVFEQKPERKFKKKLMKQKNIDERRYECVICNFCSKDSHGLKCHFNTKKHITAQAINELQQLTEQNLFN